MEPLTPTQNGIFSYILEHLNMEGIPPTLDEIASSFGYKSINAVRQNLHLIAKKGYIKVHRGKSRGIQVLKSIENISQTHPSHGIQIPLIGKIAAGVPILAYQEVEDHLTVPASFLSSGHYFALRVTGESMKDIGIHTGDIAVIRHQNIVTNGEIAAVVLEDEATLKRFLKLPDRVVLKSENPAFPDIVLTETEGHQIRIEGKLVGLLTKMV